MATDFFNIKIDPESTKNTIKAEIYDCDVSILHMVQTELHAIGSITFAGLDNAHPLDNMSILTWGSSSDPWEDMTKALSNIQIKIQNLFEKVDVKKTGELTYTILFQESCIPFLNSVRRFIMNTIPVLAIDRVMIHRNDSHMVDEILSHRLSLIPVQYKNGCLPRQNHETKFTIDVYFDEDADKTLNIVKSESLLNQDSDIATLGDGEIPITLLRPGKGIHAECWANVGIGSDHIKYSCVSTVSIDNGKILVETLGQVSIDSIVENVSRKMLDSIYKIRMGLKMSALHSR